MKANAQERAHMQRVAGLPCLVCGVTPVCVHHVTGCADRPGRVHKNHRWVTPLCPKHHDVQHGPRTSVHGLGHRGFFDAYGIDLLAEAKWLEEESMALGILE